MLLGIWTPSRDGGGWCAELADQIGGATDAENDEANTRDVIHRLGGSGVTLGRVDKAGDARGDKPHAGQDTNSRHQPVPAVAGEDGSARRR